MFGTVDVKTRPLRLAFLVEPNNGKQVREAIRLSSTLWGGAYFPIITLYRRMPANWKEELFKAPPAKEVIRGYLEAFDPDVLVQFSKEIPSDIGNTGLRVIKPEEIWSTLDEEQGLSPKFGIGIFELLDDIFAKYFRYKPKFPMRVVIPKAPNTLSLFWASWLGELPAKVLSVLEESYFEPLEIQAMDFEIGKLRGIMARDVLFPRRIAQYGLNHYNRSWPHREAYVYFLDGDEIGDIVDFWNLRALGKSVIPVPRQLQNDPQLKEMVVNFLRDHRLPRRHNPKVCDHALIVRARSRTMEELKEYAKTLTIEKDSHDPSDSPFFALQHWYPRIWEEWARNNVGEIPDDIYGNEEYSTEVRDPRDIKLRALLPEFAEKYAHHGDPRCANEVSFQLFGADEFLAEVFPKSFGPNFRRTISGLTSFPDWRVGRNGLVKIVAARFSETRSIPTAEATFFAWLSDLGWEPQLSPPGLLAKQIYKRLMGNPAVLQNETLLGLLEHMNGGRVKKDLSPVETKVKKDTKGDEYAEEGRDLSVGEVKNRLKGSSGGSNLHDYLISRGIFKLGIRVQCPHCLRSSWFPLESVRDNFTCPRCLNPFPAIGNVAAPDWRYKTAGAFSVPKYAEGAYAVLLALERLGSHRSSTMRTTPVLIFKAVAPNKKDIEADFAMFWQEEIFGIRSNGILLGECKTYGVFEKRDFERMRYLANEFPGAILAFSTLRRSLASGEVAEIKRIAKSGRKHWKPDRPVNPVLVLTGTELLSLSSPPYCWEASVQKKFARVYGLFDICDATQQIYLGLPSWHYEWHEKWEKRRQRRALKKGF